MPNFKFVQFRRKSIKHGKYIGISIWKTVTISTEMKFKLKKYKSVDIYYDTTSNALQIVCFEDEKTGTFILGWSIATDLDGTMPKGRYHWQPEVQSAPNVFIFKLQNNA